MLGKQRIPPVFIVRGLTDRELDAVIARFMSQPVIRAEEPAGDIEYRLKTFGPRRNDDHQSDQPSVPRFSSDPAPAELLHQWVAERAGDGMRDQFRRWVRRLHEASVPPTRARVLAEAFALTFIRDLEGEGTEGRTGGRA